MVRDLTVMECQRFVLYKLCVLLSVLHSTRGVVAGGCRWIDRGRCETGSPSGLDVAGCGVVQSHVYIAPVSLQILIIYDAPSSSEVENGMCCAQG